MQATVVSVCSYGGLQGAGNRDYCAVATQGVSKWNPCWPGWCPAGGRGQCVYACHRALGSSMAQTDAHSVTDRRFRLLWLPYVIGGPLYFCPVISFYLLSFFFFLA